MSVGLSECSSYADLIIVDLKDGRSTWCVDIIQVISVGVFWFLRKYFVSLKTSRLGDTLGHLGTSITSEKRDIKNDESTTVRDILNDKIARCKFKEFHS